MNMDAQLSNIQVRASLKPFGLGTGRCDLQSLKPNATVWDALNACHCAQGSLHFTQNFYEGLGVIVEKVLIWSKGCFPQKYVDPLKNMWKLYQNGELAQNQDISTNTVKSYDHLLFKFVPTQSSEGKEEL